ncbi:HEAT repeat domain-containing protein [Haloplanus sp. GCM10025708]|uniref:HEAT repeat domain-containing protein n=1 Tax=Haloferacaceae TaxID=1644056 RepID=UPI00361B7F4E
MSLYQLEKDGDTDALLDYLHGGETAAVRRRAAEVLGDLGVADQQIVEKLVRAAIDDDDEAVRGAAIDALDRLGEDAIEQLVVSLSGQDADSGLGRVRARAFVKTLSADRPELRMASANALGRLGDEKALPALVGALTDSDPRVRARAARACGKLGDPRAVDALRERVDGDDRRVRRAAADALAAIGSKRALAALVDQVEDDSPEVRYVAASALGDYDGPKPIDALVETLTDDDDAVRRAAVYSIVKLLSNAPSKRGHEIRQTVVERLGETADESVVDALAELLEEGRQVAQRRNAVWLLGRVVGETHRGRVVGALVSALGDDDETTAQFAATSLVAIGGDAVVDALLDLLEAPGSDRAAKAVFVLGKVGGDRARDRLESFVESTDDPEVRKQALSALSKLDGGR